MGEGKKGIIMGWVVLENIVTLLLACGLSTGFFWWTGSKWSFLWLLLIANMNFFSNKKETEKP